MKKKKKRRRDDWRSLPKNGKITGIVIFILLFIVLMIMSSSETLSSSSKLQTYDSTASLRQTSRRYDFKIYVYDLPPWANKLILERNPECRNSVFATEIVIHEQIMRDAHGVLTRNPEEADFFFVPIYAACLVYKDFGLFNKYRFIVKSVLDYVMEKPYWHRSGGRDHVFPLVRQVVI